MPSDVRWGFVPPSRGLIWWGYAPDWGVAPGYSGDVTERRSLSVHQAAQPRGPHAKELVNLTSLFVPSETNDRGRVANREPTFVDVTPVLPASGDKLLVLERRMKGPLVRAFLGIM
jgi:hypothetical protein